MSYGLNAYGTTPYGTTGTASAPARTVVTHLLLAHVLAFAAGITTRVSRQTHPLGAHVVAFMASLSGTQETAWNACLVPPATTWEPELTATVADAYQTEVQALEPWAYYRLNEAGATGAGDMRDDSGNGRHGTYDARGITAFQQPGAMDGDYAIVAKGGKTGYNVAEVPNNADGGGGEGYPRMNFTIAFWCKPDRAINVAARAVAANGTGALSDEMRWIMYPQHGEDVGGGFAGFGVTVGTDGVCTAEHAGNYAPVRSLLEANLGENWVFVVVAVRQGGGAQHPDEVHKIYVNGVYGADFTPKTRYDESPDNGVYPFVSHNLGGHATVSGYGSAFTGPLDEFVIFDKALTPQQIADLYETQQSTASLNTDWSACGAPPSTVWSNC